MTQVIGAKNRKTRMRNLSLHASHQREESAVAGGRIKGAERRNEEALGEMVNAPCEFCATVSSVQL